MKSLAVTFLVMLSLSVFAENPPTTLTQAAPTKTQLDFDPERDQKLVNAQLMMALEERPLANAATVQSALDSGAQLFNFKYIRVDGKDEEGKMIESEHHVHHVFGKVYDYQIFRSILATLRKRTQNKEVFIQQLTQPLTWDNSGTQETLLNYYFALLQSSLQDLNTLASSTVPKGTSLDVSGYRAYLKQRVMEESKDIKDNLVRRIKLLQHASQHGTLEGFEQMKNMTERFSRFSSRRITNTLRPNRR